jgi:ABC-type transporter Mla maintaining outer membrane lipid asymmetry ATPase subunit MlaF
MNLLSIENFCLKFDNLLIFEQINLSLEAGQSICIETAVLDGGSSFLKCCAGILQPTKGNIFLNGQPIQNLSNTQRFSSVAYCYEHGGLISTFTNFNNIAFPLIYSGMLKESCIPQRINSLARQLGLTKILHKEPHELNDVQTRLMNLLRALCIRPKLLLLDEIQAGMSDSIIQNTLNVIKREQFEIGFALIMTTTAGDKTYFADHVYTIQNNNLAYIR